MDLNLVKKVYYKLIADLNEVNIVFLEEKDGILMPLTRGRKDK
jgi:hypothetical protein